MKKPGELQTLHVTLLLVVLVLATFGGALGNALVFDDTRLVERNPVIDELNPVDHFRLPFWSRMDSKLAYYRPLTTWTLALDRALFGPGPGGHHLIGLVLHAVNGVRLIVVPRNLSVDYFFDVVPPVTSAGTSGFFVALITVILAAILVLRLALRRPQALFGALAAIGGYLLVSHLVFAAPIVMVERALYLPMTGIASIIAAALGLVAASFPATWPGPRAVAIVGTAVALPMAIVSHDRTRDWKDDLTLFSAATQTTPRSALSWNNLGAAQRKAGNVAGALNSFEQASEICPDYLRARLNHARLLRMTGRLDAAEDRFRTALRDFPESPDLVWVELAQLLELRAERLAHDGRDEEARELSEEAYERALEQATIADEAESRATFFLIAARSAARLGRAGEAEAAFSDALAAVVDEAAPVSARASTDLRLAVLDEFAGYLARLGRFGHAGEMWLLAAETAQLQDQRTKAAQLGLRASEALFRDGRRDDARDALAEVEPLAEEDRQLLERIRAAQAALR